MFRRAISCLFVLLVPLHAGERATLAPGILYLKLSGEGEALGLEYGRLLAPEVRQTVRDLDTRALGPGSVGKLVKARLLKKLPTLEAHVPERYRAELRGIAQGAGVAYRDLLLINCVDDLLHHAGCSSVILSKGTQGGTLHGRNLDYRMGFMARCKVVVDLETRGHRLRLVTVPGQIGGLTGMNDRGLSLSNHTSRSTANGPGEPTGFLYRRLLEDCGSLGEAEAALRAAIRPQGNNLALGEARTGKALALECDAKGVARREPTAQGLFVTNHYWMPELAVRQNGGLPAWGSASRQRLGQLQKALPEGTAPTSEALQRALSIHRPNPRWVTPSNNGTVLSVVMEPESGRLWIAKGLKPPVTQGGWLEVKGVW